MVPFGIRTRVQQAASTKLPAIPEEALALWLRLVRLQREQPSQAGASGKQHTSQGSQEGDPLIGAL